MARKHLRIKLKANNISPCHIWYYNYYISKGQISKKLQVSLFVYWGISVTCNKLSDPNCGIELFTKNVL